MTKLQVGAHVHLRGSTYGVRKIRYRDGRASCILANLDGPYDAVFKGITDKPHEWIGEILGREVEDCGVFPELDSLEELEQVIKAIREWELKQPAKRAPRLKEGMVIQLRNATYKVSDDDGSWYLEGVGVANDAAFEGITKEPHKWIGEILGREVEDCGVFPVLDSPEELEKVVKAIEDWKNPTDGHKGGAAANFAIQWLAAGGALFADLAKTRAQNRLLFEHGIPNYAKNIEIGYALETGEQLLFRLQAVDPVINLRTGEEIPREQLVSGTHYGPVSELMFPK